MKCLIIILFSFFGVSLFAQNAYKQKVYSFVQKQETGEEKHFIYIEMVQDSIPIWDSAIINKRKYVVHFSAVENMPLTVGARKSDKRMVVLKATPDTKMWMVEMDETNDPISNSDTAIVAAVIFKGKFKGRKLTYKILSEVELD